MTLSGTFDESPVRQHFGLHERGQGVTEQVIVVPVVETPLDLFEVGLHGERGADRRGADVSESYERGSQALARITGHDRKVLERRIVHLEERVTDRDSQGRDASYDRAELAALRRLLRD